MMKKLVKGILLVLLLAGMLNVAFKIILVGASPAEIHVPAEHARIQWAIGNATPGDTIIVHSGTYEENIVVDKSLTILAANGENPIVNASGVGSGFNITSNNVTIFGFTIINAYGANFRSGIYSSGTRDLNISGNTITNCLWGVYLYENGNGTENVIASNVIYNGSVEGFSANEGGGVGILLFSYNDNANCSNNIVINNTIYDMPNGGIFLGWNGTGTAGISVNNTISGNDVHHVLNGSDPTMIAGILLNHADNNTIFGNEVHDIYNPTITQAYQNGMYMYESENNHVYCIKFFSNNGSGIAIWSNSTDNKFYLNRLFNNSLVGFRCWSDDCVSGTEVNFNTIKGNSEYGVNNYGPSSLNATNNWWGHITGPTHSGNPSGRGDNATDHVDYAPWLTAPSSDVNLDGKVDITDLVLVIKAFGSSPSHLKWSQWADINVDSKIDVIDLVTILRNYGKTYLYNP